MRSPHDHDTHGPPGSPRNPDRLQSPEEYAAQRKLESDERLRQFQREEAEREQRSRNRRSGHDRIAVINDTQGSLGRSPAWLVAAVVVALVLYFLTRGCGDDNAAQPAGAPVVGAAGQSGQPATPRPPATYVTRTQRITQRLNLSANKLAGPLAAASVRNDVVRVRRAARSQLGLLNVLNAQLVNMSPPAARAAGHAQLIAAARAHRAYLATLVRTTSGTPAAGLAQLDAARRQGEAVIARYRAYHAHPQRPPGVRDGETQAGIARLTGLRRALRDAQARQPGRAVPEAAVPIGRRATVTPASPGGASATPSPAPRPSPVTDYIDRSTGSVSYRFSPRWDDRDLGEGPHEGNYVTINCYVRGERVQGSVWWARLDTGYYIPGYYLHNSRIAPPDGAPIC